MKKCVICFFWQGDRWRSKAFNDGGKVNHLAHHLRRVGTIELRQAAIYINRLHAGVKRNTSEDIPFICFTNEPLSLNSGIEVRPFTPPSPHGVLPRLYMFSESAGLFGYQVLCLDIDVVITGSLDDILGYDGMFCARAKFKKPKNKGDIKIDGDIIGFYGCKQNEARFWTPFIKNRRAAEDLTLGRERMWIRHVLGNESADIWQNLFPGQIVSYKRHVRGKGIDKNMRIVSFHGKPRPHQAGDAWIKRHWKV
jgi:hypothetical protein